MTNTPEPTSSVWPIVERIVSRYEDVLRSGKETRIENFLEVEGVDRSVLLAELVHVDLEHRLSVGKSVRVEQYLKRYPELAADATAKVDLIKTEYMQRRRREKHLRAQEYVDRFPELAAQQGERWRLDLDQHLTQETHTQTVDSSQGQVSRSQSRQASSVLEPKQAFGKFQILEVLGRGAFGTVYRALDTKLDRQVALKVPHENLRGSSELMRFAREARAAAELDHPNICSVYEIDERQGLPYIAMAFIPGKPLSGILKGNRRYPARHAAKLVRIMALALETAHQRGVVHRDLKPANIIIKQDGGQPVIMDFGLAQRARPGEVELTHSGQMLGTPLYMPPEQARGDTEAMGPVSDIYSLGVILYQLLTGRCPFLGSMAEVFSHILNSVPEPPSKVVSDIPTPLEEICLKALQKDPSDRFASMQQMADALKQYLQGADESASVVIAPQKSQPKRKEQRTWIIAAACTAAALLILLAAIFWGGSGDDRSSGSSPQTPPKKTPVNKRMTTPPAIDKPVDLIAELDLDKHRILGQWRRTSEGIVVEPQEYARLVLPAIPLGSYRLHIELTRLSGTHEINLILPVAQTACMISLGQNPDWWGLQHVNGQDWGQSKPNAIVNGKRHKIDVRVSVQGRQAAIDTWLDGRANMHWQGPTSLLTLRNEWLLHPRSLGLGAHVDRVVFHQAIYSPADPDPDSLKKAADDVGRSPAEVKKIQAHTNVVWEVHFSPDGKKFLSAGGEGIVKVWNLADGKEIARLNQTPLGLLTAVFSPDGKYVLAGGLDEELVLWDIAKQSRVKTFRGHRSKVWSCAFTPDGRRAVSGCETGEIIVWDVETGKPITQMPGHKAALFRLAMFPDGSRIATVGADGTVRLWDLEQYRQIDILQDVEGYTWEVAVSDDGKTILTDNGPYAGLIDVESGKVTRYHVGHTAWIRALAISPDGRRCLTGSEDQTIRLWNTANGKTIASFPGHRGDVLSLRFSADGRYALSGGQDGTVRLWKMPAVDEE